MAANLRKVGVRAFTLPEGRLYTEGLPFWLAVDFNSFSAQFETTSDSFDVVFPSFALGNFQIATDVLSVTFPTFSPQFSVVSGATVSVDALFPTFVPSFTAVQDASIVVVFPSFSAEFTGGLDSQATIEVPFATFVAEFSLNVDQAGLINDTNYVVWVMNQAAGRHSNYTNWNVNSHGKFNGKEIIALPDGLYEVTGNADAGTAIPAKIYWTTSDLGTHKQKRLDSLSVNMRSLDQDTIRLAAIVDEQQKRVYDKNVSGRHQGIRRHRQLMPKGLNGQNWKIGFENADGGDFLIDEIEVISVDLSRTFK